jgi:uncharacterized membrane protein
MPTIHENIDVNVPVRTAYDQWTQFEDFPRFMEGVERVVQLNDTTLEWTAKVAGKQKSWEAKIVTQEPDREIAWQSTSGAKNNGVVRFESLASDSTRIDLSMDVDPEGAVENVGTALQVPQAQVKGDLERFKHFVESRGQETGAWRGSVEGGSTTGGTGGTGYGSGSTGAGATGYGTRTGTSGSSEESGRA